MLYDKVETGKYRMYTIKEFAAKLDLSVAGVKHHVYNTKSFTGLGQLMGHTLIFTDADIAKAEAILKVVRATPKRKPNPLKLVEAADRKRRAALRSNKDHGQSEPT